MVDNKEKYQIKFVNKSGFAIMLEYWVNTNLYLSSLESICIESSDTIHYLNSSVGEYIINNSCLDEKFSKEWIDNGYQISYYRIGKFRSSPSANSDYSWMDNEQFDCVYNKLENTMTFIKKNPSLLENIIQDKIQSMDDLINMIKNTKYNKYYSIGQIYTINRLIEDKKLKIINNSQLIELNSLDILSEINIIYLSHEYLQDDYEELVKNILPKIVNLTELYFNDSFNLPINFMVNLVNLKKVYFGYYFNQDIDVLCNLQNLEELYFSSRFDKSTDLLINLNKLEKIHFDENYKNSINLLNNRKNLKIICDK